MLLKSLVTIGAGLGLVLGIVGTSVPWLFPNIFTSDLKMHKVLAPYFIALAVTPATLSLEGTLLAGRDFKFVSLSMSGCFSLGAIVLLLVSSGGYGLPGCWYALLGFQWVRPISLLLNDAYDTYLDKLECQYPQWSRQNVGGSLLKAEEALQSSKTECCGRWRIEKLEQFSETSAVAGGVD